MVQSRGLAVRVRSALVMLIVAAVAAGAMPQAPASATEDAGRAEPAITRIAGQDRFETGALAAQRLWPLGADTVVLATGGDFPDALAGGAVAAAADAPLLLTASAQLLPATAAALEALSPERVVILGGPAAVSPQVESQVRALSSRPSVERIAGASRFETAELAAAAAGRSGSGPVVVATGSDFPDAVAAGALLVTDPVVPVTLATRDRLMSPLQRGEQAVLIGGPSVLGPAVHEAASAQAGSTIRLEGNDRFSTSLAVAEHVRSTQISGPVPLIVASGQAYPDALSAGAVAARLGGVLLLTPAAGVTAPQADWLRAHRSTFDAAVIMGGPAAVSSGAEVEIGRLLRGEPVPAPPAPAPPAPPAPAPPPPVEPGPPPLSSCVDINRENDLSELQRIIHIGPQRAPVLIGHRPYASLDDLMRISGIGPARLADIKAQGLAAVSC